MTTYLVTGATGGLGRNAVNYLLSKGATVYALGRKHTVGHALACAGAHFVPFDLCLGETKQLNELLEKIDVVWHCAALSAPSGKDSDFMAINVHATARLLACAGQAQVKRFIHISSPSIYFNFQHHLGIPESFCPARYANAYAYTKALAEDQVRVASTQYPEMRSTILRPRAIFGEHDQVLLPRLLQLAKYSRGVLRLPRAGRVLMDLSYVGNVVAAMDIATKHPTLSNAQAFNITNQQPVVLSEVLMELFQGHLKRPLKIRSVPYRVLSCLSVAMQGFSILTRREPLVTPYSVGVLQFDMTLDNQQARTVLGYIPPVSMSEGLQRTAYWLQREHHV